MNEKIEWKMSMKQIQINNQVYLYKHDFILVFLILFYVEIRNMKKNQMQFLFGSAEKNRVQKVQWAHA